MKQTASIGLKVRVGVSRVFLPPEEPDGIGMRFIDDIIPRHVQPRELARWLDRKLASSGRELYAAYYKDDKSARGLGEPSFVMVLEDVVVTCQSDGVTIDISYESYKLDHKPSWWNADTPPSRRGAH